MRRVLCITVAAVAGAAVVLGIALYATGPRRRHLAVATPAAPATQPNGGAGPATAPGIDEAAQALEAALRADPTRTDLRQELLRRYHEQGQWAAVVRHGQVLAEDPQAPVWVLLTLAYAHHRLDQCDAAAEMYERVLARAPDNVPALNNLAYLKADVLGDPEEAVVLAWRAAELRPADAMVLDTLGWALGADGRLPAAEVVLRAAVTRRRAAVIEYHLAVVLLARPEPESRREGVRVLAEARWQAAEEGDARLGNRIRALMARARPPL